MGVTNEPADDASTLVEVLRQLSDEGYRHELIALGDSDVRCAVCDEQFGADEVTVDGSRHVEVASDPDESSTVIWGTCPNCGQRVVSVLGYGSAASPTDQTTFDRLDVDHSGDTAEPNNKRN